MASNNNRNVNTQQRKKQLSKTIVKLVMNIIVSDMEIPVLSTVMPDTLSTQMLNVFRPYDTILSKLLELNPESKLNEVRRRLERILQEKVRNYTEYKKLAAARNQNEALLKCQKENKQGLERVFNTPWYKQIEDRIVSNIKSAAQLIRVYDSVRGDLRDRLRDTIGKQLLNKIICGSEVQEANKRAQNRIRINLSLNGTDRTTEAIDILFKSINKTELVRVIFLQLGKCGTLKNNQVGSPAEQNNIRTNRVGSPADRARLRARFVNEGRFIMRRPTTAVMGLF